MEQIEIIEHLQLSFYEDPEEFRGQVDILRPKINIGEMWKIRNSENRELIKAICELTGEGCNNNFLY